MDALLIVDVQNDFMPGGSLPVARGDEVVMIANLLAPHFELVVATQDWHPAGHLSFASSHPGMSPGQMTEVSGLSQVLWPDHCVQNTPGASFHSGLDVSGIDEVVRKGTERSIDSYSGFFDNGHLRATGLDHILRERGVERLVVLGVATDYCVKFTALDARELGYRVDVVTDGVRAVDLEPGDGERALGQMREAGCRLILSSEAAQKT